MLPALKVGGVYRARIVRILSGRRIRLEIAGALLGARVEAPVREGEEVTVVVERLLPEVTFSLRRPRKNLPARGQSLPLH